MTTTTTRTSNPSTPARHRELTDLVNVGPRIAAHLARLGITEVDQLAGRDPLELFDELCATDGVAHDPCLLDTMMSAVDQADVRPGRPWWHETAARKRLLAARAGR